MEQSQVGKELRALVIQGVAEGLGGEMAKERPES